MEPVAPGTTEIVQRIGLPMHQSKGWLKLLGIISILSGALVALTIVGVVIAWLPIWLGVLLYQSADLADRAYATGDERQLIASLSKLKTYFTIYGVMAVIGIACWMIVMSIAMLAGISGFDFGPFR
jgi:hypothetical protein